MPASAVTVTPTFTNDLTSANLSINMPMTGTKTATIPSGVTSFKVYDDGGASGNYSNNCKGTLVLTAPEGYVLQLSGSITTETNYDKLTVYDNSEASGTKLLDAVSSSSRGTETAIGPVVSSGQSMTLYFYSGSSSNFAGLDLTVTLVSTNAEYNISGLGTVTGGSVAASVSNASATTAKVNDMVTLTATPESGYMLSSISVTDAYSNAVAVTGGWYTNNQATFTMPASAVTVTPTFTNDLTSLYINMPATGTQTATIPAGITTFKVYDDGGKSGNYSDNCKGTLVLTAPEGYVLQLSGSITTETNYDKLTVYDNSEASGTKLLDEVSSTSSGTETAITTVTSSGQSMTLYFYSNGSNNYAGLDLTVTLVSTNAEYNISGLGTVTGGSVAASVSNASATTAKVNDMVTLTATPESGYMLSSISVTDAYSNAVAVTGGWYTNNQATFTMPASAVTVTPTFTNDLTSANLSINMPMTGTKTATIPSGVTSFKVYDDGGASGNYSNNCKGTLVLTAPEGYVLQLSGSITTETNYDKLTVYDNSEASGTKLLDAVSSSSRGTETAIGPVVSSGQSMTLYFYSGSSSNFAGLDLTVTLVSTNAEYNISGLGTVTGGSVAASVSNASATTAKVNDMVTLTATPESGYMLSSISVTDAYSNAVAVTGGWYTNNQATFTMPASAVTVTPTFTNDLTSANLSINMPMTGTKTATIPSGVTSFKVYDDGGASGNYSNNCKGTLVLTAPEGYVLQLSGSITTETNYDKLTVYDNSEASGTKLLDAVSSSSRGTETAIGPVVSSGQSMTLYFYSGSSSNFAGLDLTVTLVSTNAEYNISGLGTVTGGSVAASVSNASATTAKVNDMVTLTATPESGYMLSSISVTDAYSNAVAVTGGWYTNNQATFTMPASAVTVTPTFTNDLTSLYINMPATGTQTATIPAGITTFKVYDDGGKSGNYSDNCKGTLVLTAPEGYVLQLSGSITTQQPADNGTAWDKLTVYNGSTASGTKLLDEVSSTSSGTETAITTVTSSGQSMTLYFYSNGSNNYAGLDLTVTLVSTNAEYNISGLGTVTGGSVAASVSNASATTAKVNDMVTLTATPESGYMLSSISVTDAYSNAVAVTGGWYTNNQATFTMPASAVTVTPTFTNDLTSLYINMPATGTQTATIPAGITTFKVYDDGGKSGNYSKNCSGTLVLTAPEGYVLQLSGCITTEKSYDKLTVYDGGNASATILLDAVSSTSSGTRTAITTVTSSGQSMTLYFYSDNSGIYAGLDLTVNVLKPLELANYADNTTAINNNKGMMSKVTLSGRTLLKNGDWNTLCLPFSLTAAQIAASPLAGATIKELLSTSNLDSEGKLTLNFQDATAITAGKPYMVKWAPADNLTNPVFDNVTIDKTMNDVCFSGGSFKGTYAPLEITDANRNEVLLLATGNKLGYAKTDRTVANGKALGTCRAYFEITGAAAVRSFIMDFGDEQTTGITTTNAEPSTNEGIGWYDLSGRRLQGKPTEKGVYIQNGKKTIIK